MIIELVAKKKKQSREQPWGSLNIQSYIASIKQNKHKRQSGQKRSLKMLLKH